MINILNQYPSNIDVDMVQNGLSIYMSNYFSAIYPKLLVIWNEESIKGFSCKWSNILQYVIAFQLAVRLLQEVQFNPIDNWNNDEENRNRLIALFDLKEKQRCLECSGINLGSILVSLGLTSPITNQYSVPIISPQSIPTPT